MSKSNDEMNFLLIPGAWMGEWIWDSLITELQSPNLAIHSITLTGLSSKDKYPNISLETHVTDVIDYIENYKLIDIDLVGHSYSGLIAGQIADRIPEKIARLVFIEAILPSDGKSMLESGGNDVDKETKIIEQDKTSSNLYSLLYLFLYLLYTTIECSCYRLG